MIQGLADPAGIGWLDAVILGLVEGLTEFLPVSSTGHLIIADRLLGQDSSTMEIGIQAGAITAIAVLYRKKLLDAFTHLRTPRDARGLNLLLAIVVAALPAIVLGALFHSRLKASLMNPTTVALATLVGGGLLLALEGWLSGKARRGEGPTLGLEDLTAKRALTIGLLQTLALIPGTSRSAATIAGGLVLGMTRAAAAEFSFLVGLPILYGACALQLWKARHDLHGDLLRDLAVGGLVAFVAAALVVGPFVRWLQRHTFVPFAVYRICAGLVILALFR